MSPTGAENSVCIKNMVRQTSLPSSRLKHQPCYTDYWLMIKKREQNNQHQQHFDKREGNCLLARLLKGRNNLEWRRTVQWHINKYLMPTRYAAQCWEVRGLQQGLREGISCEQKETRSHSNLEFLINLGEGSMVKKYMVIHTHHQHLCKHSVHHCAKSFQRSHLILTQFCEAGTTHFHFIDSVRAGDAMKFCSTPKLRIS